MPSLFLERLGEVDGSGESLVGYWEEFNVPE
jgi:hypothetical protein